MQVFKPSKRTGFHWKNLQKTIRTIKRVVPLDIRGDRERKFEDRIAGALTLPFKEFFIDQRNTKQVMTRVSLFDHDHRPDMSIDTDGVAVEVKDEQIRPKFQGGNRSSIDISPRLSFCLDYLD